MLFFVSMFVTFQINIFLLYQQFHSCGKPLFWESIVQGAVSSFLAVRMIPKSSLFILFRKVEGDLAFGYVDLAGLIGRLSSFLVLYLL
jgi:hypothetical protein